MSTEGEQPEDIAGLFRKFGGDPMAYKEFAPRDEPGASAGTWPLIAPATTPHRAPGEAVPLAPVSALFAAPAPVRAVAPKPAQLQAVTPTDASVEPRELDALFARLLGTPQPAVPTGHGLLSRWRSPS